MQLRSIMDTLITEGVNEKLRQKYKLLWRFTQTDYADGDKFDKLEKKSFGGKVPEKLFALMNKSANEEDFVRRAINMDAPDEIKITANGMLWKVRKMGDSTHFKMLPADSDNWSAAAVYHIGQVGGKPYASDIDAWLHGAGNPDGKKY